MAQVRTKKGHVGTERDMWEQKGQKWKLKGNAWEQIRAYVETKRAHLGRKREPMGTKRALRVKKGHILDRKEAKIRTERHIWE